MFSNIKSEWSVSPPANNGKLTAYSWIITWYIVYNKWPGFGLRPYFILQLLTKICFFKWHCKSVMIEMCYVCLSLFSALCTFMFHYVLGYLILSSSGCSSYNKVVKSGIELVVTVCFRQNLRIVLTPSWVTLYVASWHFASVREKMRTPEFINLTTLTLYCKISVIFLKRNNLKGCYKYSPISNLFTKNKFRHSFLFSSLSSFFGWRRLNTWSSGKSSVRS